MTVFGEKVLIPKTYLVISHPAVFWVAVVDFATTVANSLVGKVLSDFDQDGLDLIVSLVAFLDLVGATALEPAVGATLELRDTAGCLLDDGHLFD